MFSRRAGYKDSTIVSSPASVTLSVFIDAFIDAAVLSGRCTCLDSGFPGAPGQVGDFLSFYLSNIVRFVFQDCFVFMPCQVIMRKNPRAPGTQMLQVQAHLYSLARLVFAYNRFLLIPNGMCA